MVNKAIILGNVCAKPELRHTTSGTAVATFTVACTEKYKDKQGNQQEQTEFLRCVAWNRLGEICSEYLDKGSKVYCEGKNTIRKWQDQNGNDRYSHEVVLKEMKMIGSRNNNGGNQSGGGNEWPEPPQGGGYDSDTGSDVPF